MRVTVITLLALLALSACSAPRKSVAELEAPRSNAARAVETPAPDYPYTWRPRQLPKEPACYDAAMCYDEKRQVSVLFGGSKSHLEQLDRTFTWNGTLWQRKDCWEHPGRRTGHALVYDSKRMACVLFGGRSGYEKLNDTWEWNGSEWRCQQRGSGPSPRAGHSMVFDSVRNVIVLFGGQANAASAIRYAAAIDSPLCRAEASSARRVPISTGTKCRSHPSAPHPNSPSNADPATDSTPSWSRTMQRSSSTAASAASLMRERNVSFLRTCWLNALRLNTNLHRLAMLILPVRPR